jgi:hypothetical protein
VIWEPFVLALFLGLIVSAGLYFAYLWPSIEPLDAPLGEPIAGAGHSDPAASAEESSDRDADHDDADKPAAAEASS